MSTGAVKPKRDRNKVTRVKADRGGKSLEMKKKTVKLSEEEDAMLQYILDNKMVEEDKVTNKTTGKGKISMRDFFAECIREEYNRMKGGK